MLSENANGNKDEKRSADTVTVPTGNWFQLGLGSEFQYFMPEVG